MSELLTLTVTHLAYSRIINNQFTLPLQDTHETTTKIYAPVLAWLPSLFCLDMSFSDSVQGHGHAITDGS